MNHVLDRRIQIIMLTFLACLALFALAPSVLADNDVLQGSSVATGETVENDVLLTGTAVSLDGGVAGDVLIVGRTIVVNGDVQGSMIILGENVIMNGQVEGSVYALAVSFSHLADAVIDRSLYFLGVSLQTEKESEIGRDLTAVTLGIQQAGNVGRDPNIIAGIGEIARLILDRINATTTGFTISEPGSASESSARPLQIAGLERFAGSIGPAGSSPDLMLAQDEPADEATTQSNAFVDWLVNRLRDLISYLLVGGLLIWLFPRHLENWADQVRNKPLAAGGWGLVAYIVGFVAQLLLFLLILAIGLSLAFVTLWSLAWAWWGVSLSALALAFSLFLVAIAFISKIILAYWFGRLLFERFSSSPNMRKPWPLLVGLTIYVILSGVPYLGWAISLLVTFLGLGAIWLAYTDRNNRQKVMAGAEIDT